MSEKASRHERSLGLNNALRGVAVGLALLVFGGASLALAAQPAELGMALAFVLATLVLFEAFLPMLRQMRTFDASRITSAVPGRTPWTTIGRVRLYRDLLGWPLWLALLLGLLGIILYVLVPRLRADAISLPWSFYLVVGIYATYFIVRRFILRLIEPITSYLASVVPSYTLHGDTIVLDTKMQRPLLGSPRRFGFAKMTGPVRFRMNELDEVRLFTWSEYQSFIEYELGPDFPLMVRHAEQLEKFVKREIDRPAVFHFVSGQYPIVLLRGPEIFYLVSFAKGAQELLEAFERFKARDKKAPE